MSGEGRMLDAEILENMKEGCKVSPTVEARLQEAYDRVGKSCRERRRTAMRERTGRVLQSAAGQSGRPLQGAAGQSKRPLQSAAGQRGNGRPGLLPARRKRGLLAALIAAAVLAASSLCVAAAMHYFDKQLKVEEDTAAYTFNLNYELQPVEVTAVPGWLPEGMTDAGDGKYYPVGESGHGISIFPINTLNLEQMKGMMSFDFVENVEETVIQGMEAHIITFAEDQKYRRGKDIFLFNPQEGYVIWLFGDYNIPAGDLRKVAENLEITAEAGTEPLSSVQDDLEDKGDYAPDYGRVLEEGLRPEELTALGEELICESAGCGFTVTEAQLYDSLDQVPGYTETGVLSLESLRPWLNGDGTHKPYMRTRYDGEGKILAEEEAKPKFLAVTVTARQFAASVWDGTFLDANLVRMTPRQDGTLGWKSDYYMPTPDQEYELQLDGRCFYIDRPESGRAQNEFFLRKLGEGESLTYTMVFAVDSDILEDEDTVLVLNFNSTSNDPMNPMYSALE